MTYPPQPGASPHPGGWDPGTPPSYPGQGNQSPEPPRKNRTGLWVAVAAGVVVVAALGITGFVAPGFFLGDKDTSAAAPSATPDPSSAAGTSRAPTGAPVPSSRPGTGTTPTSEREGPAPADGRKLVDTVLAKLNAKDAAGLNALVCPGMADLVKEAVTRATTGDPHLTADEPVGGEDTARTQLGGTLNGKKAAGFVTAGNVGGTWCVANLFVFAG